MNETKLTASQERFLARRQELCQKAAEAGLKKAVAILQAGEGATDEQTLFLVKLSKAEVWWVPAMASLTPPERRLVQLEAAKGFARLLEAVQGATPAPATPEATVEKEPA